MAFAVAFVVVALMALWLPLVTGSSKPRLPFLTLAGILGGLAVSRNEWPGLPVGSWLSALPCYIALGGLLLGGLWFRYRISLAISSPCSRSAMRRFASFGSSVTGGTPRGPQSPGRYHERKLRFSPASNRQTQKLRS